MRGGQLDNALYKKHSCSNGGRSGRLQREWVAERRGEGVHV